MPKMIIVQECDDHNFDIRGEVMMTTDKSEREIQKAIWYATNKEIRREINTDESAWDGKMESWPAFKKTVSLEWPGPIKDFNSEGDGLGWQLAEVGNERPYGGYYVRIEKIKANSQPEPTLMWNIDGVKVTRKMMSLIRSIKENLEKR